MATLRHTTLAILLSALTAVALAQAAPAGMQLPFEPDPALLTRMQQGRCWSEFRLYDPVRKVLGETLALEWYDAVDHQPVIRLYARKDGVQHAFRRVSLTYKRPGDLRVRTVSDENGPDQVGATWTATYAMGGKLRGFAELTVIEGAPHDDEHISTGSLRLPGIMPTAVTVAHSAGCDWSLRNEKPVRRFEFYMSFQRK
jgi:hypothetical protein